MKDNRDICKADRWARFRFSVIGPLWAEPPEKGELGPELQRLAAKVYQHPVTGTGVRFGLSTVERWYYAAREATDPLGVLRNRLRKDEGAHPSVSVPLRALIRAQHGEHPSWSYRLHYDNLLVQAQTDRELGRLPSYAVVRRWGK